MPGRLSIRDREDVYSCLIEDRWMSWAEIGRRLGRHPSSVLREVVRNGGRRRIGHRQPRNWLFGVDAALNCSASRLTLSCVRSSSPISRQVFAGGDPSSASHTHVGGDRNDLSGGL